MATFTSTFFGQAVMAPHSAGELMVVEAVVTVTDELAADDLIKFGYLPAGCVPVDMIAAADELDTNATDTLRLSFGLLNSDGEDLVAASLMITAMNADAAVNVVRAGDVVTDVAMLDPVTPVEYDRIVAAKVTAAAATPAAGDLRVKMFYRASVNKI